LVSESSSAIDAIDESVKDAVRVINYQATLILSVTTDVMASSSSIFWFAVEHMIKWPSDHDHIVELSDKVSVDDPLQCWALLCPTDEPSTSLPEVCITLCIDLLTLGT